MTSNLVLWITTFIMLAGGGVILATGKRRTQAEELHTVLHGIVPIIAACSYFAMATGQGLVLLPTDAAVAAGRMAVNGQVVPVDALAGTRLFYYARYVDWSFTTPMLLLALGLTAMRRGPKRHGALLGAVLADLMMIVTAYAFGASLQGWMKWSWFIVSCAAFGAVYYVIWVPQMEASALQRDDVRATYRRNAAFLSVVWLVYPVILALAPDGSGAVGDAASVLVIAVLDVVAKVVYGVMSSRSDAAATDRDLAEGEPALSQATGLPGQPVRRAA